MCVCVCVSEMIKLPEKNFVVNQKKRSNSCQKY